MGAAFRCIYIVDKAVNAFRVGIVMLHCHFHINIIFAALKIHDIFVKRRFALIQIGDEFLDSALVVEHFFLRIFFPHISEYNS